MKLLVAQNLSKGFRTKQGFSHTLSLRVLTRAKATFLPQRIFVFENLSLEIAPGECIGISGVNGSGKSTLLRCLAGVMSSTSGTIEHHGRTLAILSHGLGAYEELSVWKNMVLTQQLFGVSAPVARANLPKQAEIAGLSNRLASPMTQLSEGMRAKVALSALCFADFQVLLMDESLNHVDAECRAWFYDLTRQWLKEGRSLIITSHDSNLLAHFATRQLLLRDKSLSSLT